MPGFRPFANEISSKGPTGSIMPTFDNFKKDYKPPSKPRKQAKDLSASAQPSGTNADFGYKTDKAR